MPYKAARQANHDAPDSAEDALLRPGTMVFSPTSFKVFKFVHISTVNWVPR
jgi:hypothetical protein